MDSNQASIIELLREVHLVAFMEIEWLNMSIDKLENQYRLPIEQPVPKPVVTPPRVVHPAPTKTPSLQDLPEMLNEKEVAEYLILSVASVARWRLFRKGPKFVKFGSAVRYRREEVQPWLNSCSEQD
ncbi:helix-turn-helix transcriptional regulator [Paludibaculum fermentans]|uniref:helix-turn-helix transcriptional regulator n=1 Tax=Paludibaculum fermentans TaxID=1473598 RepID=UPI003EBC4BC3